MDPKPPKLHAVDGQGKPIKRKKRKRKNTKFPPGARTKEEHEIRKVYVMEQFRLRPYMGIYGPDGINALLQSCFGIGLGYAVIKDIKDRVIDELTTPTTLDAIVEGTKRQLPPPVSAPKSLVDALTDDIEAQILTGAELICDAIPNLRTFNLTVDDSGEISVDYTVRKVIVQKGTAHIPKSD